MILSCLYIRVVVLVAGEFFHYLSQGKVVYCKYVLGELSGWEGGGMHGVMD